MTMAVKLSRAAFAHAKRLVGDGKVVLDERDDWSEHQPSTADENRAIAEHGWVAFGRWHLGRDDARPPRTKAHYKYPYGDFEDAHRCAVLSAEVRAAQYKHDDIERAAAHLHGMLDALRTPGAR
jgi:hypothetical protein